MDDIDQELGVIAWETPYAPRWFILRCWLLHSWWAHRSATDDGVTIRHCPRCNLVVGVSRDDKPSDKASGGEGAD